MKEKKLPEMKAEDFGLPEYEIWSPFHPSKRERVNFNSFIYSTTTTSSGYGGYSVFPFYRYA